MEHVQNEYKKVLNFVNDRRKGTKELYNFISKRIKAELQYSKALQSLSLIDLSLNNELV